MTRNALNGPLFGLIAGSTVVFALSGSAHADVRWQMETTGGEEATEKFEIWADDENLRMTVDGGGASEGAMEFILLGETDQILVIDHGEKTYIRMDSQTMNAKTKQLGNAMSAMQDQMQAAMAEAMADLSPQERAQAQAAMANLPGMAGGAGMPGNPFGAASTPTFDLVKKSEKRDVLNVKATAFQITKDGEPDGEVWAIKPSAIKGGKVIRARMQDLEEFVGTAFGELMPANNDPLFFAEALGDMVAVGGVDGGRTTRLISAAEVPAPESTWSAPEGYRQEQMPF
ncbi:MAG: hypothetical protein AAF668_05065 [Pseudomonadota bacterium]